MKISNISFSQFCDEFSDTYKNNFTYDGKRALFDYLEQLGEDIGEEVECDIVAICCDYTQYNDLEDLKNSYPNIKTMEDLEKHTTVIPIENSEGFIIQNY